MAMPVALATPLGADTFPAYEWPDDEYICPDLECALSDEYFILWVLDKIWTRRDGADRLAMFGGAVDWFAANPVGCTVHRNDHSYSLRQSATTAFWGWLTVMLKSPTIMVTTNGPEKDANAFLSLRSRTFLMNVCGRIGEQFGHASSGAEGHMEKRAT